MFVAAPHKTFMELQRDTTINPLSYVQSSSIFLSMPAEIPAELKEKVKMLAFQIGVREAARQCEVPESTVQYWSWNEDWMKEKAELEQTKALALERKGLQPLSTINPVEVLGKIGGETKLVLAKAVKKTAKQLNREKGVGLIRNAQALKSTVDAGSKLHQWEAQHQVLTQVNVNVAGFRFQDNQG